MVTPTTGAELTLKKDHQEETLAAKEERLEPGDHDEEEGSTVAPPSSELGIAWDHNVTKFGQVPLNILKRALQCAERSVFSAGNLNSIIKRGAREPPHSFLSQCVELVTNMDPAATIEQRFRNHDGFVKLVCDLNGETGRQARGLVIEDAFKD